MRALLTGWILFAVLGCGGSDAVHSDGSLETLGEVCTVYCDGACVRAGECGLLQGQSVAACESQCVTACCVTAGNCLTPTRDPVAASMTVNKCTHDFDNWDCSALSQGFLPPTCIAPQ